MEGYNRKIREIWSFSAKRLILHGIGDRLEGKESKKISDG